MKAGSTIAAWLFLATLPLPISAERKPKELPQDASSKIEKLSIERVAIQAELKELISQRQRLLKQMETIRQLERAAREKDDGLRKEIYALRTGKAAGKELAKAVDAPPDSRPLVEGPIKEGAASMGTILNINAQSKVISISTHAVGQGYANQIFILGEGAAVFKDSVPTKLETIPNRAKATYWLHPQDSSTITWLEAMTK
jgi:hypothetical protein